MSRRVSLRRVCLTYAEGVALHTATSGVVSALDELRLVVEDDGAVAALGATRLNIAYLSGIPAEDLCRQCLVAFDALDFGASWTAILGRLPPDLPAPGRMLFDMAATDGAARAAGVPLAVWLGGTAAGCLQTNQTLFLTEDAVLLERARAYAARGFLDLKLRVGAGAAMDDLRRARILRDALGLALQLSVDANGSWGEAEAPAILAGLAVLGVRYAEQPVPAGDWVAIARVSRASAVPVMLDESLASLEDIRTLIATAAAPMAHLKLAKLGGLDRLVEAARMLRAAGIAVMVGQMNEGSVATLAAAHAAAAAEAAYRELYGADGLRDDPAGLLRYADGCLELPPGPGLGLARHDPSGTLLRDRTV